MLKAKGQVKGQDASLIGRGRKCHNVFLPLSCVRLGFLPVVRRAITFLLLFVGGERGHDELAIVKVG